MKPLRTAPFLLPALFLSVWLLGPQARANLISNGSFEAPPGIQTYVVFGLGSSLPGWTIENGTVEIVGPYWQAAAGSQSLDLNGIFDQIGTIYQDVPTVPGQRYRVRFAYAGNPEGGPDLKTTRVFWNGEELETLTFDITGKDNANMGWEYHEYVVTAAGSTSRLRFQSTTPLFCGPTLDDVSVMPLDGPPPPPSTNNVVSNGSFEAPPGIQGYVVFSAHSPPPGWTIESGTVEIVGPYWQAAEGTQSLDLNGVFDLIGTIYQDVPTVPGQRYRIRFAYAGNPEGGPDLKTTRVFWNGEELETLTFDITGKDNANMGWEYHEYVVTAAGSTSRLRFQSTTPLFCGPTLDDVSVTPLPDGPHATHPPPWVHLGLGHYPHVTIVGEVGRLYRIESAASPRGPWEAVTSIVLPASPYTWYDLTVTNRPHRFYRAVLVD